MQSKHIHFIGICGVAMGGLAIAFQRRGWKVTGSDAGFYPPISTHLKNSGIEFYPGWHPEKMTRAGAPDLVVVGNVAGSQNPEWQYAEKHKLNYKSYPEVIAEFFVKPNSIVCAGTYGKTTVSAILSWILLRAGLNPSYMFGGLALNDMDSAAFNEESGWSVLEGDEYKSSQWDASPKFTRYSPAHLLLTAVSWDHADVFPTEESYINAFKQLIALASPNGNLVACADNPNIQKILVDNNIILSSYHSITLYGTSSDADCVYSDVKQSKDGIQFIITDHKNSFEISSPLLGVHNAENICACFAMALEIGIPANKIIDAISTFGGVKRRLERRQEEPFYVYDDIGHSPAKAKSALKILRAVHAGKIIAIFEPNTGNRRPQIANAYANAFQDANEIIVPELTKIKVDPNDPQKTLTGQEITDIIGQTHPQVRHIFIDDELTDYLSANLRQGDVAVFLGSHGFRGMIEQLTLI